MVTDTTIVRTVETTTTTITSSNMEVVLRSRTTELETTTEPTISRTPYNSRILRMRLDLMGTLIRVATRISNSLIAIISRIIIALAITTATATIPREDLETLVATISLWRASFRCRNSRTSNSLSRMSS